MSNNNGSTANVESSPKSAGSGIRLPPISFLSRSQDNKVHVSSLVLPITPSIPNLQSSSENGASIIQRMHITNQFGEHHGENSVPILPTSQVPESTTDVAAVKQELDNQSPNGAPIEATSEERTQPNELDIRHSTQTDQAATQSEQTTIDTTEAEDSQVALPNSHVDHKHHHHHHHRNPAHRDAETKPLPHSHHHHHHHHHHYHKPTDETNGELESRPSKKAKGPPVLDKGPLHELLNDMYPHRHHLGTILYNPTTTWATLQILQLHGLRKHDKQRLLDIQAGYEERLKEKYSAEQHAYIPVLPPLTDAYINSFVDVKIPYKHIKQFLEQREEGQIEKRRELWGGAGGVYTDDSNILSVLCHVGLFNDALNLTDCNSAWTSTDLVKPLKVHTDIDGVELLDLSVTLLLLPTLKEYHGFWRNGINSRSWTGDSLHDGLSFGIYSVKWETYVAGLDERNLSKLAQKEFVEDREAELQLNDHRGWKFDYNYYKKLQKKFQLEQNGNGAANGNSAEIGQNGKAAAHS